MLEEGSVSISRILFRFNLWQPFLWAKSYPLALATYPHTPGGPFNHFRKTASTRHVPIWCCSEWGLPCPLRHRCGGGLLHHRFALACALFTQCHWRFVFCCTFRRLGSFDLLRLAVSQHSALWSPDFPLQQKLQRLPDPLPK